MESQFLAASQKFYGKITSATSFVEQCDGGSGALNLKPKIHTCFGPMGPSMNRKMLSSKIIFQFETKVQRCFHSMLGFEIRFSRSFRIIFHIIYVPNENCFKIILVEQERGHVLSKLPEIFIKLQPFLEFIICCSAILCPPLESIGHTLPYVCIIVYYPSTRCLMVSTNQADPSCFYFRIT